jgi:hypothetical protein
MTSAVITEGPEVLTQSIAQLGQYCTEQGVTARELIGEAARHVHTYEEVAIERRL